MKLVLQLSLIIVCLSIVNTAQIKNKNINELLNKTFISNEKYQQPEDISIKNIDSELQKMFSSIKNNIALHNSLLNNTFAKSASILFKPAKIVLDSMIETLTYDDHGNLISEEVLALKVSGWEKLSRYTYTIENGGKNQGRLQEVWLNNKWVNKDRYSVTNDENGNGIEETYETWNDTTGTWQYVNRNSTIFTNPQRPDSRMYENWLNGAWLKTLRYNYKYNESGQTLETLVEKWANDSWISYARNTYTFNNAGKVASQSIDMWLGTGWLCMAYASYSYDDLGNLISGIAQRSYGAGLQNVSKFTYTYDANRNIISTLNESWTGTDWAYINRTSYTYDKSNHLLTQLEENREDSVWVNSDRYSYTYDASGNELSKIYEVWTDSTWQNNFKRLYGYDSYGNGNHAENYQWQNNAWVSAMGEIYFYYNNNKDEIYIYSLNADVEYLQIQLTDIKEKGTGITAYNLAQNYPNPFNPTTRITYSLPKQSFVTLIVYNSLGQEISQLVNEVKPAGTYNFEFNANTYNLPSGVYFYKLTSGEYSLTKKLVLLK